MEEVKMKKIIIIVGCITLISAQASIKTRQHHYKNLSSYKKTQNNSFDKKTIKTSPKAKSQPKKTAPTIPEKIGNEVKKAGTHLLTQAHTEAQTALKNSIHHHVRNGVHELVHYGHTKVSKHIDAIINGPVGGLLPYLMPKHKHRN